MFSVMMCKCRYLWFFARTNVNKTKTVGGIQYINECIMKAIKNIDWSLNSKHIGNKSAVAMKMPIHTPRAIHLHAETAMEYIVRSFQYNIRKFHLHTKVWLWLFSDQFKFRKCLVVWYFIMWLFCVTYTSKFHYWLSFRSHLSYFEFNIN